MIYCYVLRYFVVYLFIFLFLFVLSMLNIASSGSLVNKLTLISYLTGWLVLDDRICKSSARSNHINLSNNLNDNVCIVFLLKGEITIIIIIIIIIIVIIIMNNNNDNSNNNNDNNNKQIFHSFLFNMRNYSPEVSNILWREEELNIILPRVNNFDIAAFHTRETGN